MKTQQKPIKPPSAYNLFFSFQSRRYRERENASLRFFSTFPGNKPKMNTTQEIAKLWSKKKEEERFLKYFELQSKERVDEYKTKKLQNDARLRFSSCFHCDKPSERYQSTERMPVSALILFLKWQAKCANPSAGWTAQIRKDRVDSLRHTTSKMTLGCSYKSC